MAKYGNITIDDGVYWGSHRIRRMVVKRNKKLLDTNFTLPPNVFETLIPSYTVTGASNVPYATVQLRWGTPEIDANNLRLIYRASSKSLYLTYRVEIAWSGLADLGEAVFTPASGITVQPSAMIAFAEKDVNVGAYQSFDQPCLYDVYLQFGSYSDMINYLNATTAWKY